MELKRRERVTLGTNETWADLVFSCRRTINGILAMRSFLNQFSTGARGKDDLPALYPEQLSIIVAMLSAGTVLGSLVSAPVGDYFGRRLSLIGAVAVFCFGVIFQVCADNISLLLVGRCVAKFKGRELT